MTRKDYIRLARAIRNTNAHNLEGNRSEDFARAINLVIENIERELYEDNPRFQRDKFRSAIFGGYSLRTI